MRNVALSLLLSLVPATVLLSQPHPERLPQTMDRLARSQSEMATKQAMLLDYASKIPGGSARTKTFVEERLRDLVNAQSENTRIYSEFKATLHVAGAVAPVARVAQLEEAESKLGQSHLQLTQIYGPFWEKGGTPGLPGAPTNTAAAPVVPPAPAGAPIAALAQITAPVPGTPPPFGGNLGGAPTGDAGGDGPAASAGEPAPVSNGSAAAPSGPPPVDDGEAAYRKTLAGIQATLTSSTASDAEKQAAYSSFLKLKTTRRERFK